MSVPSRSIVRHATPEDASALVEVLRATHATTWLPEVTPEAAQAFHDEDRPSAYVAARGLEFTVAEADGRVVGFVDWEGDFVNALHVHPEAAGMGIGRVLMDTAEAAIRRSGYPEARLETDTFNARARALYAARGYRELDIYPDTTWNSGLITVLLVKTL